MKGLTSVKRAFLHYFAHADWPQWDLFRTEYWVKMHPLHKTYFFSEVCKRKSSPVRILKVPSFHFWHFYRYLFSSSQNDCSNQAEMRIILVEAAFMGSIPESFILDRIDFPLGGPISHFQSFFSTGPSKSRSGTDSCCPNCFHNVQKVHFLRRLQYAHTIGVAK